MRPALLLLLALVASMGDTFVAEGSQIQQARSVIPGIGVNFGQLGNNLPAAQHVAQLLQSTVIAKVRIFNTEAAFLHAMANTGIDVAVGVCNADVPALAANASAAAAWVSANIAPFAATGTRITLVTVGNEVFSADDQQLAAAIVPAIRNIHTALAAAKLADTVHVSTPHSFAILDNSFPPSSAAFRADLAPLLDPLLRFLADTRAPLLVNAYPYFAFAGNPHDIPLPYALFQPNAGAPDPKTGLIYTNMYTAQVDAAVAAMERMGHFGIPVAVTETGWPSQGGSDEVGASVDNARAFTSGLVAHLASSSGTPLRPRQQLDTYIFALFNEDLKPGPASERNYGLFATDGTPIYDAGLLLTSGTHVGGGTATATTVSSSSNTTRMRGYKDGQQDHKLSSGNSWCVAKTDVDSRALLTALNYACGQGEADCKEISSPAGSCFQPNSLVSHASYAFNMFYHKYGRKPWNCDFGNTATLTATDPSYGSCSYPAAAGDP
ncbi:glucan endo-1,3-beta-D-glucosidase isoform X1 [Selaginella moellendorffii]|uniref:glucan endo-1,3-beta-D-glucosidase isoform X1 n=1 Tax=Selaginella moellendorffii TaxID=88036 RepID=UPI000D1D030C|nr:glucan endo-1,3-beta-D-glucosidase isoform X1 [Selaginella moellendorffii]|eukprot:XP_024522874.1 glucan endo-1,3-beta-D-glucosidase isoform X1 [Selaginella moellendorffii]